MASCMLRQPRQLALVVPSPTTAQHKEGMWCRGHGQDSRCGNDRCSDSQCVEPDPPGTSIAKAMDETQPQGRRSRRGRRGQLDKIRSPAHSTSATKPAASVGADEPTATERRQALSDRLASRWSTTPSSSERPPARAGLDVQRALRLVSPVLGPGAGRAHRRRDSARALPTQSSRRSCSEQFDTLRSRQPGPAAGGDGGLCSGARDGLPGARGLRRRPIRAGGHGRSLYPPSVPRGCEAVRRRGAGRAPLPAGDRRHGERWAASGRLPPPSDRPSARRPDV